MLEKIILPLIASTTLSTAELRPAEPDYSHSRSSEPTPEQQIPYSAGHEAILPPGLYLLKDEEFVSPLD